jgi:hypothetical protein
LIKVGTDEQQRKDKGSPLTELDKVSAQRTKLDGQARDLSKSIIEGLELGRDANQLQDMYQELESLWPKRHYLLDQEAELMDELTKLWQSAIG